MTKPYYPDTLVVSAPALPGTPRSFCVTQVTADAVRIKIAYDGNTDAYELYTSSDGLIFTGPDTYYSNNFIVNGLAGDSIVYFKIAASNATDTGKLVNLGFPFETVYPEDRRFALMQKVLTFFKDSAVVITAHTRLEKKSIRIYPNPVVDQFTIDLKGCGSGIYLINIRKGEEIVTIRIARQ